MAQWYCANLVERMPGKLVPERDSRFESGLWRIMQINIKSCKPEDAEGLTVLIDVIHASSTIVQLLDSGVEKLIPIFSGISTKKFKEQGFLIFGERFSSAFKKSEYLNSPFVAESMDLK